VTRAAAKTGFESFLRETVEATREEFSVERVLSGAGRGLGLGGRVVSRLRDHAETLERRVVDPELDEYHGRARRQFDVVLDYAESDEPIGAYREAILAHDTYVSALDEAVGDGRREAVVEDVLERHRRIGDGLAPVVDSDHDDFWTAAEAALDGRSVTELVEGAFPFTGPLRRHRGAIAMEVRVEPGEVLGGLASALPGVSIEYTDEALRAMTRAEERVVGSFTTEIDRRFDDA
jgi:hypothetical protein